MPNQTSSSSRPVQHCLKNGLRVRLLCLPAGSQAAALIRVHAGSHDAPLAYPGLAHFLEHLLFLGSRNYPVSDSLMSFVQGCGGQLNASTRERHTDFFFQVPLACFQPGLSRLLDMLALPLLDPSAQLREREVIHAEYEARGKDGDTLCDAALGYILGAGHPFGGFHAGNRHTLPVEQEAFQEALWDYHRRFYQTGQMELLLAAPCAQEELMHLAKRVDSTLQAGFPVDRPVLPLPVSPRSWHRLQLTQGAPRLLMAFVVEGMPDHSLAALDYLGAALGCEAKQGLLHRLRERGLCRSLQLRVPYWFDGQGVLVIEAALPESGLAQQQQAQLAASIRDWLRWFAEDGFWQAWREEYCTIRRRGLQVADPLTLLKYWVDPQAWDGSDEVLIYQGLNRVLGELLTLEPVLLSADTRPCPPVKVTGFPLSLQVLPPLDLKPGVWRWELPQPNPWLRSCERGRAALPCVGVRLLGQEEERGLAAFYLCWHFNGHTPPMAYAQTIAHALQGPVQLARQAGVELRFEDLGYCWQLALLGVAEALPLVLSDLAELVTGLAEASLEQGVYLAEQALDLASGQLLIRQLMMLMPRLLTAGADSGRHDGPLLGALWKEARWQCLAIGFSQDLTRSLHEALIRLPGQPSDALYRPTSNYSEQRWLQLGSRRGAETALLMFCPMLANDDEGRAEAAWRLLGQLMEGAFFRRLRSELQLGYAVFSRFVVMSGQAGMLFGVQSPSSSADRILGHIDEFLDQFALELSERPVQTIQQAAHELAERFKQQLDDLKSGSDLRWQACMSGQAADHAEKVMYAMHLLNAQDLCDALNSLRNGAGRILLSNRCEVVSESGPAMQRRC